MTAGFPLQTDLFFFLFPQNLIQAPSVFLEYNSQYFVETVAPALCSQNIRGGP